MKCARQNFFHANDSRLAREQSSCEIRSAKTPSRCVQVFWRDCSPFSIETFAQVRNASPFLKSVARSFRHPEKKNAISAFCFGETPSPPRIGDRKRIAVSICSI